MVSLNIHDVERVTIQKWSGVEQSIQNSVKFCIRARDGAVFELVLFGAVESEDIPFVFKAEAAVPAERSSIRVVPLPVDREAAEDPS